MRRLLGAAILASVATTGCLTMSTVYEARQPSRQPRTITGITGAAVDGERVIIGLTVQREHTFRPDHLEIEIPLSDLEWARKNAVAGRPQLPGLVFARPPRETTRKSTAARLKLAPIDVEPIDPSRLKDLATLGAGLEPGIHVLSLQNFPEPGRRPHTIPAFVDTREGHEPYGIVIADVPDARIHRKWLLLLVPLTVPVDAVTLPIQLVALILVGGC